MSSNRVATVVERGGVARGQRLGVGEAGRREDAVDLGGDRRQPLAHVAGPSETGEAVQRGGLADGVADRGAQRRRPPARGGRARRGGRPRPPRSTPGPRAGRPRPAGRAAGPGRRARRGRRTRRRRRPDSAAAMALTMRSWRTSTGRSQRLVHGQRLAGPPGGGADPPPVGDRGGLQHANIGLGLVIPSATASRCVVARPSPSASSNRPA